MNLKRLDLTFKEVLRSLRRKKGLSQEELSIKCGFENNYISRLESGGENPNLEIIFKIAGGLNMKPSEFIKVVEKVVEKTNEISK